MLGVTAAEAKEAAQVESSSPDRGFTAAEKRALVDMHNEDRRAEGAADMYKIEWDEKLAEHAQEYADQCPTGHSSGHDFGENLSWSMYPMSIYKHMNGWSEEEKVNYDYNSNYCMRGQCGHYTQIVWSKTTKLGCGRKKSGCNNGWGDTMVCQFSVAGNLVGAKPFTKGAACSKCFGECDNGLCIPKTSCSAGDLEVSGASGQDAMWNGVYYKSTTFQGKTSWESTAGNFVYFTGSFWAISYEKNTGGYNGYQYGSGSVPTAFTFLTGSQSSATVKKC
jgi:pathogenesis-related protein 1